MLLLFKMNLNNHFYTFQKSPLIAYIWSDLMQFIFYSESISQKLLTVINSPLL